MSFFPTCVLSGRGPPPAGEDENARSHSRATPARALKFTPRCHETKRPNAPKEKRRGQSADRRNLPLAASYGCRSALIAARSPLGAPPRLSFRRPNATTQLRAALHSLADRYVGRYRPWTLSTAK